MKRTIMNLIETHVNKNTTDWKGHYTGISVLERGKFYFQRNTRTKKLDFARYSFYTKWFSLNVGIAKKYNGYKVWTKVNSQKVRRVVQTFTRYLTRNLTVVRTISGVYNHYKEHIQSNTLAGWKAAYRMYKCQHTNMEVESVISGDSGTEYFNCPDCGMGGRICYY